MMLAYARHLADRYRRPWACDISMPCDNDFHGLDTIYDSSTTGRTAPRAAGFDRLTGSAFNRAGEECLPHGEYSLFYAKA
jgi:hypothetical protein